MVWSHPDQDHVRRHEHEPRHRHRNLRRRPRPRSRRRDVLIVELNPFDEQTGGGLFRWEDPDDRALLEHGPLGLRMATQPQPRMQATIEVFTQELRDS